MHDTDGTAEKDRISQIAQDSWYTKPTAIATIEYSYEIFKNYIPAGARMLEMGPAEGTMTRLLVEQGYTPELLDGSPEFVAQLRARFPDLTVHESLFEDFKPHGTYDVIFLGHVLEHVENPVEILSLIRTWLTPGTGRVVSSVPNCRSLHRQAAVIMGLLDFEESMSEKDHHHGHRRVYSPETFRRDFLQAGLRIEFFGGYWMKPVSDAQIEATWTKDMLWAFMKLGERYPDIAGELVVVAQAPA